jgi:Zn finger protein HypA/HybF involved in hydrogenase expression
MNDMRKLMEAVALLAEQEANATCTECGEQFYDAGGDDMCQSCEDYLYETDTAETKVPCKHCDGTGIFSSTSLVSGKTMRNWGGDCPRCGGHGYLRSNNGVLFNHNGQEIY